MRWRHPLQPSSSGRGATKHPSSHWSLDSSLGTRQVSTTQQGPMAEEKQPFPVPAKKSRHMCSNQKESPMSEKSSCLIGWAMPSEAPVGVSDAFHHVLHSCRCTQGHRLLPVGRALSGRAGVREPLPLAASGQHSGVLRSPSGGGPGPSRTGGD